MHPSATPAAVLFAYAFLSNIALAIVPHEPAIIWYGPRLGVWTHAHRHSGHAASRRGGPPGCVAP